MGQSDEQRPSSPQRSPDLPPVPPPIQPYSGFLGNGKSVIRPIAFKPLGGRLSAGGERYGSTPVLASRPPSLMTLYGSSSDVRESRWCGSPQPASLSALPPAGITTPLHQRHHSAIVTKSSSGLSSENKEPVPAPSPADSGVSELERDQNDYSTAERLRGHEVRVRAPRGLALQGYTSRRDEREAELARVRRDRALLRQRLEDTEWSLCQRAGEIALLKTQLKEAQNEQTAKGHEYLTLKADCRQLREALDKKEKDIMRLRSELDEKESSVERLQSQVDRLSNDLAQSSSELGRVKEASMSEVERLKSELNELRQELSDISLSGYEGAACGRQRPNAAYHWSASDSALEDAEVRRLNGELEPDSEDDPQRLRRELRAAEARFRRERARWADEKDKVLRYQKQLQLNYVQMFKRSRALEAELDGLRLELRLCDKSAIERAKPIEL